MEGGRKERGGAIGCRIRGARMVFAVWLQASCSISLSNHFLVSKGGANNRAVEKIGRSAYYKACRINVHSTHI